MKGPRRVGRHFRPQPITIDGHRFDSKSEGRRYGTLRRLCEAGLVRNLEVHPQLPLIVNGKKIGRGFITLDFKYEEFTDGEWRLIYEDHKPIITRAAKTRIEVAEAANGVTIRLSK